MLIHQARPGFRGLVRRRGRGDGSAARLRRRRALTERRAVVVLGLTGSIGMGKTTEAGALRACGARVYDADAGGPPSARARRGRGGDGARALSRCRDGRRPRTRGRPGNARRPGLRRILTRWPQLEAILHPLVRAGERRFLAASQRRGCRLAVLDMPLLFETGGEARCDATLVVTAPAAGQRARVLGRARMSRGAAGCHPCAADARCREATAGGLRDPNRSRQAYLAPCGPPPRGPARRHAGHALAHALGRRAQTCRGGR